MNPEPKDGPPEPSPAEDGERRARAERVERLFREHNEALVRFLLARLGSPQEAREVAQEAYVRLLSLDEPEAVGYLRAFLFKTAANLAIDRRRRGVMHSRAMESPLFREFADARTPERQVAGTQAVERLQRLLAAMPLKCRQAFILNRFDGMDVASISRELGISERMVQKYIARALLFCRAGIDAGQVRSKESGND
jgi:RNA polymerase sigma factor (sigma-70 family)